ncbi:MAG: succinate dehydrogenase cytochrome b subunit [Desulfuromonas thiophila]|nr:succinate dehydrogenase cytochrome b subunit [Desulfuromonas thiophila]MDY0398382.1 succinate dehydrogenase cytochrome b subunit [Desulfuromonas thiophila]
MQMLQSSVGRKLVMAVTGFVLVSFVIVHLLGNSSVFVGADGLNAYAEHLHALGPLVWVFRLVMLAVFALHIAIGIQLTLENRAARPIDYNQKKNLRTSFGAETMIFTGLAILAFVVYHLFHFTMHVTNPEISASALPADALGRADVFSMVVLSFQKFFISLVYVGAMVTVLLHLSHGIQSLFQTLGCLTANTLPVMEKIGRAAAIVIFVGFISIPVSILLGLIKV